MADAPETIVLEKHRDLEGRRKHVWIRRGVLAVFALIPVLAILNVFGQRPATARASADAATLDLYAPTHVRGGLLYEARFHIFARRELKEATLLLDPGWAEGVTINTVEPSPIGEGSTDGKLTFELGHVPAGEEFILFMQFQVNPTTVGHHDQDVELRDGDTHLVTIDREVTVFP